MSDRDVRAPPTRPNSSFQSKSISPLKAAACNRAIISLLCLHVGAVRLLPFPCATILDSWQGHNLRGVKVPDKTILVVEDEENLRETLRYKLNAEGYRVITAVDGEQAVEQARSKSPDLVLLDLMLPKLDGFDVCRILRKESAVPILMLTAKGEEVEKVVGLEVGADDYVTKPFSPRELVARIKALLRRADT